MTRIPVPDIDEIPAATEAHGTLERAAHDGWTPEQLTESFAYFAIAVYTAYFTNFAATELDVPSILPAEA